jgi:hypothetical protein
MDKLLKTVNASIIASVGLCLNFRARDYRPISEMFTIERRAPGGQGNRVS